MHCEFNTHSYINKDMLHHHHKTQPPQPKPPICVVAEPKITYKISYHISVMFVFHRTREMLANNNNNININNIFNVQKANVRFLL